LPKRQSLVHFDIDPSEVGKTVIPVAFVIGDIKGSLTALNKLVDSRTHPACGSKIRSWQENYPLVVPEGKFLSRTVLRALNAHTKGEAIVATDVGPASNVDRSVLQVKGRITFFPAAALALWATASPLRWARKFARPDD